MATRYPGAEWDPLGPQTEPRMQAHDIVCLHTMAASFDGVNNGFHVNGYGGLESHFGLAGEGRLKQWQDTEHQADANYDGNHRVISIETADRGLLFPLWSGSDVPAWTDRQIDELVPLVRWLCDTYDIPKELIPDSRPGRRGIGYHRQGIPGNFPPPYTGLVPGGELWTDPVKGRGKVCPGERRIRQLIEIVIPRVRGEEDDDMPLTDAEWKRLSNLVDGRLRDPENLTVISRAVIDDINREAKRQGAPLRTMSLEMSKRGVNESLGAADGDASDGLLGGRLQEIESKLDALAEPGVPDVPPPA